MNFQVNANEITWIWIEFKFNSNSIQFNLWFWLNESKLKFNSIQFGLQPMKLMGIVTNWILKIGSWPKKIIESN